MDSTQKRIEKVTNMISESIDLLDARNREEMISDLLSVIRKYIPRMEETQNTSKYPDGLLYVRTHIRHCEDASVNGSDDISDKSMKLGVVAKMPCMNIEDGNYYWTPVIDMTTGQITNWRKGTTAITYYKVVDECSLMYETSDGVQSDWNEDYVPDFLCPDENGYGDYMYLTIDADGFIQGWNDSDAKDYVKSNIL